MPDVTKSLSQPFLALRKIGRCANGAERGQGFIYHAVEKNAWSALCGDKPGRQSAGWNHEPDPNQEVTCKRCLKKLEAIDG